MRERLIRRDNWRHKMRAYHQLKIPWGERTDEYHQFQKNPGVCEALPRLEIILNRVVQNN